MVLASRRVFFFLLSTLSLSIENIEIIFSNAKFDFRYVRKVRRSSYLLSYFARLSRRGTKRKGWRKSWSSSRKVSYLFAGIFAGIRSVTSRTRSILVVVDELVTLRVVDELAIP